ncbi:MAG: DsbA family protein [Longimicrobiales bacterium]|nr:DsbA family protein [Longimicrobiales bacterium]
MSSVRLYLDYVDPGSYLMEVRVARVTGEECVAVERIPWEVRAPPTRLIDPDDPAWRDHWERRADEARREGLELVRPTLVPWTRKAHELGLHAREKGCFDRIHIALLRAVHEQGRDVGRVDVLVELARECGLDASESKAVLDVDRHTEAVVALRVEAVALGVSGVPTLVRVGDGARLEGVHDTEVIRDFLAA